MAFPASLNGESFGRWPDASGPLTPLRNRTFGTANTTPRVGPLLISEIMVQPSVSPETDFEFVEIWNPGSTTQNLSNWTLRGDVDFNFTNQSLPAGGRLVVVGFNPVDTPKVNAFLTKWAVSPIVFAGPWSAGNTLANTTGTVRLRRADDPPVEEPLLYPQVIEDEVFYATTIPWPIPAGPGARSLNRTGLTSFGSDAASWTAATATPGLPPPGTSPSGYDAWVTQHEVVGGAAGDSDFDGIPNLVEYALGLNPGQPDINLLPQPVQSGNSITYTFPKLTSRSDVPSIVQVSSDLNQWTTLADSFVSESAGVETRRAIVPFTSPAPVFFRLRVTR